MGHGSWEWAGALATAGADARARDGQGRGVEFYLVEGAQARGLQGAADAFDLSNLNWGYKDFDGVSPLQFAEAVANQEILNFLRVSVAKLSAQTELAMVKSSDQAVSCVGRSKPVSRLADKIKQKPSKVETWLQNTNSNFLKDANDLSYYKSKLEDTKKVGLSEDL